MFSQYEKTYRNRLNGGAIHIYVEHNTSLPFQLFYGFLGTRPDRTARRTDSLEGLDAVCCKEVPSGDYVDIARHFE
jgi:hypothetical protein